MDVAVDLKSSILEKVYNNERLTQEDAVRLFYSNDLLELGMAANFMRRKFHPEPDVTYIIDRNINYTNVCYVECSFCAFYRSALESDSYLHGLDLLDQVVGHGGGKAAAADQHGD